MDSQRVNAYIDVADASFCPRTQERRSVCVWLYLRINLCIMLYAMVLLWDSACSISKNKFPEC